MTRVAWFVRSISITFFTHQHTNTIAHTYVCVCTCRVRRNNEHQQTDERTYIHTYIHTYTHLSERLLTFMCNAQSEVIARGDGGRKEKGNFKNREAEGKGREKKGNFFFLGKILPLSR